MNLRTEAQYLTGKLLLALPEMGDPRFYKAVIFMCAHSDEGAMGLVVNVPLSGVSMREVLKQTGLEEFHPNIEILEVVSGGPVEAGRGFLLHTPDRVWEDTTGINEHFSLSGSMQALRDIAEGKSPREVIFALGYAGWGAGQLERELQDNAWLVTNADYEIMFNTPSHERWNRAYTRMGVNPDRIMGSGGRA
ncbi:MAG: YqgE/AlgH family protein [Pseudobdellovibrionaceae bacterium]